MTDVEDLLRGTFAERESMAGQPDRLAVAARRLAGERRRTRLAVVGSLVSVCAVLAAATAVRLGTAGPATVQGAGPSLTPAAVPPGWRVESSLGVELAVPGDWTVNDYGCGQTAASTVVRAPGVVPLCYTPEPASKQVAIIAAGRQVDVPDRSARTDPVARGSVTLPDGRSAGWVFVASRDVTVSVRTRDPALTERILATVRPVDVDSRGCPTRRADPGWPVVRTDYFPVNLPDGSLDVTVCFYGEPRERGVLQASVRLAGAERRALVAAVNAAPRFRDWVPPASCRDRTPYPNAVLHVHYAGRPPIVVEITYGGCVRRGIDDGDGRSAVTLSLVGLLSRYLHTGIGTSGDLPR